MAEYVDFCVIGAGVVGSATALALIRQGKEVVLLEQFPLPHTRGNSHGQSRTIRFTYGQEIYAQFIPESFQLWKEIEDLSREKLVIKTGLLTIDSQPYNAIKLYNDVLVRYGCKPVILSHQDLQMKFPMLRFSKQQGAILEEEAAIIRADKSLQAMQKLIVDHGGKIYDACKVRSITPGYPVTIHTSGTTLKAKRVIITAGCWTPELLSPLQVDLPLKTVAVTVGYWKTDDGRYGHEQKFPMFADVSDSGAKYCSVYGFPTYEYPGLMKICKHSGTPASPDRRDESMVNLDLAELSQYIGKHFRGVETRPSIVERCMYTLTEDNDFIIDRHPEHRNIVFGVFAGHGFKMAPVTGKVLAQLAMDEKPSYNLSPFRLSRFNSKSSKL